jgi:hypothetical protein
MGRNSVTNVLRAVSKRGTTTAAVTALISAGILGRTLLQLKLFSVTPIGGVDEQEAIRALQMRGVTNAARLLEYATPDVIVATCKAWDGRKSATSGLLVKMIKDGDLQDMPQEVESKADVLRRQFDQIQQRYGFGSVIEPHSELQARKDWGDEPCHGRLVVDELQFPFVTAVCDECGFEINYGLKSFAGAGR